VNFIELENVCFGLGLGYDLGGYGGPGCWIRF